MNPSNEAVALLSLAFARSPRMVGRRIADEYILVPIVRRGAEVDAIFNLNGVSAFIWEKLDGQTPGGAIVQAIIERYDVDRGRATEDYLGFIQKLQAIHAVVTEPITPGTGHGSESKS